MMARHREILTLDALAAYLRISKAVGWRQDAPHQLETRYSLALPPATFAKAFQDRIAAPQKRIGVNSRQNRGAAGPRDTLLPILPCRELELAAAESPSEEVA